MKELIEIMARYLDGSASEAEVAELDERLRTSAEARATFLDFCRQATALAELEFTAPKSASRKIPWILTAGLVSTVAAIALLLSVRQPREEQQPLADDWPILETPMFATDERPPEFSTWTLCQFAFRSDSNAFGSLISQLAPEPTLTLTSERFWSGDLTYNAPTSSNLTIDIP